MRAFLLLFTILYLSLSGTQSLAISWFEYQGIKHISTDIAKNFPPDQYIYIGIGASPTPILAFIESLYGADHVIHLPLSGTDSIRRSDLNTEERRQNYEEHLRRHFDRFLDTKKIGQKKILLIDYANTGESLIYVYDKVSEYFHEKGESQTVEALGLARNYQVESRLLEHNVHSSVLTWIMRGHFIDQDFDEYRKYDSYRPSFKTSGSFYSGPLLITNQLKAERLAEFYKRSGYHDVDLKELKNDPNIHRNLKTYSNLIREINGRIGADPLLKVFMGSQVSTRPNPLIPYCRQLFFLPF